MQSIVIKDIASLLNEGLVPVDPLEAGLDALGTSYKAQDESMMRSAWVVNVGKEKVDVVFVAIHRDHSGGEPYLWHFRSWTKPGDVDVDIRISLGGSHSVQSETLREGLLSGGGKASLLDLRLEPGLCSELCLDVLSRVLAHGPS
jgi:hypothetical protein